MADGDGETSSEASSLSSAAHMAGQASNSTQTAEEARAAWEERTLAFLAAGKAQLADGTPVAKFMQMQKMDHALRLAVDEGKPLDKACADPAARTSSPKHSALTVSVAFVFVNMHVHAHAHGHVVCSVVRVRSERAMLRGTAAPAIDAATQSAKAAEVAALREVERAKTEKEKAYFGRRSPRIHPTTMYATDSSPDSPPTSRSGSVGFMRGSNSWHSSSASPLGNRARVAPPPGEEDVQDVFGG